MKVWLMIADYGTAHEAEEHVVGVYGTAEGALMAAERLRGDECCYGASVEEWDVQDER